MLQTLRLQNCLLPAASRVSRSDFYKRAIKAIQAAPPGYHGPGSDKLSTDLLDTCKSRCKDALQPCFEQHAHTGATVCSDGCGNIAREHLINIMVTSPKGAVFHSAVECTGEIKSGEYIAKLLTDAIRDIGEQNVIQVIMDSAANCVKARRLVHQQFPHITPAPCAAHCIDLALEDICKLARVVSSMTSSRLRCSL
jgi:hypothetical protein